jgi:hypothetical protein
MPAARLDQGHRAKFESTTGPRVAGDDGSAEMKEAAN